MSNGYNPLYHNCEKQGCFNKVRRPKIEEFADCFPGRISFGDVDGVVEINGYTLMLEWKGHLGEIPKGQQIMHSRTTWYGNNTVICLCGNAETMAIHHVAYFHQGTWHNWTDTSLEHAKSIVKSWSDWARRQPSFMSLHAMIPALLRRHSPEQLMTAIRFHAKEAA